MSATSSNFLAKSCCLRVLINTAGTQIGGEGIVIMSACLSVYLFIFSQKWGSTYGFIFFKDGLWISNWSPNPEVFFCDFSGIFEYITEKLFIG